MQTGVQRVAAIHDLSGFGKASLTIVIPVLSSMGIQVCPLPTAVLSTHTGFEGFTFLDLTDHMNPIIDHWKNLNIRFDAIYSGFLGSPKQVDIVLKCVKEFAAPNQLIVVDPVMGDDGRLYPTMGNEMVVKMKELVGAANLITPNLTEASLLLGKTPKEKLSAGEAKSWLCALAELGPNMVVITSAAFNNTNSVFVLAYDRNTDRFWKVEHKHVRAHFAGTGDMFTSILVGGLLQGENFPASIERAVEFVRLAIYSTYGYGQDVLKDGIVLEKVLHTARAPLGSYTYETF